MASKEEIIPTIRNFKIALIGILCPLGIRYQKYPKIIILTTQWGSIATLGNVQDVGIQQNLYLYEHQQDMCKYIYCRYTQVHI